MPKIIDYKGTLINDKLVVHDNPGLMACTDKEKLDGIEAGANKTIVDSELNASSENPVQNKVINTALAGKSQVQIITWGADD